MNNKRKPINNTNIPQYAIDRLARCFYPDIIAFYETEEGKRILQELKQPSDTQSSMNSLVNQIDTKVRVSGEQVKVTCQQLPSITEPTADDFLHFGNRFINRKYS